MKLSYKIRGIKELEDFLKSLPRGLVRVVLPAITEYLIGDGTHGLKHYPVYKYVSRRQAYGKPFQSDKQRRWFFAALHSGEILPGYPRRTGNTQRGYHMVTSNNGYRVRIVNTTRGAVYTRHDQRQARLNRLAGWRRVSEVVASNINGAFRHARAEVKKYLAQRRK